MTPRLALLLYLALSVVLTSPLVLGLGRDVPGDLGDSLLNMWILAWGAEHLPRLVTGAMSWSEFWNANIFHPEPHALALSEHLFGQALQILPVYWLTGNIILCYNLLFISTFALSAFGTYLLVRDLTGDRRAAFIAGLVYGFLPYRIASVPHLQVMSSQWMPFALWGLNRFVTTGSTRGLAGGTAALVLQNWSCGYYLLYFAPFVPPFVIHRMWTAGKLKDLRVWASLAAAAVVTLALTLPFLLPYRQVQAEFGIERPFAEVVFFSANVWSYVTASENLWLWGDVLRVYPRAEGETFLGFVPWLLALVAVVTLIATTTTPRTTPPRFRVLIWVLAALTAMQLAALASTVIFGGFNVDILGVPIRARTPVRLLMQFVLVAGLLLALSSRARETLSRVVRSPVALVLAATVFAMWLSLGPVPRAGDAPVSGFGIYGVLYDHVPGFNGVRVPARYAMIAGLFLAVLAGYGAKLSTFNFGLLTLTAALILVEGAAIPMELNRAWHTTQAMPPARVFAAGAPGVPPVYARVAALPAGSAITEFPFGDPAWEIRYVYYAAAHWKPITNGYSGGFPPRYRERTARLQRVPANPEESWQVLKDSGTTHVVLHRNAFANPADADTVEQWLKSHGATELERFPDGDVLLVLNL